MTKPAKDIARGDVILLLDKLYGEADRPRTPFTVVGDPWASSDATVNLFLDHALRSGGRSVRYTDPDFAVEIAP